MKAVVTYLMFNGNCRQAVEFYGRCLGIQPNIMNFGDAPAEMPPQAKDAKDRVMHANLPLGTTSALMASDTMPGTPHEQGNNFSVSIACESKEEAERLFKAFSENGNITMPLQDTFWGAHFGMLKDQFGIHWMFNYEYPK